jgi:hypothetical protein
VSPPAEGGDEKRQVVTTFGGERRRSALSCSDQAKLNPGLSQSANDCRRDSRERRRLDLGRSRRQNEHDELAIVGSEEGDGEVVAGGDSGAG